MIHVAQLASHMSLDYFITTMSQNRVTRCDSLMLLRDDSYASQDEKLQRLSATTPCNELRVNEEVNVVFVPLRGTCPACTGLSTASSVLLLRATILSRQTLKLGLASATLQQRSISWCNAGGQLRGLGNLLPALTWCNTSKLVMAGYGCWPNVVISHINTPNAQTSLCEVNTPSTRDSGGIQRTGSKPSPSWNVISIESHHLLLLLERITCAAQIAHNICKIFSKCIY